MGYSNKNKNYDDLKDGVIVTDEEHSRKMQVKEVEVKTSGDYNKNPVYIYHDWCKKCGICVAFCPTGALGRRADGSPYVPHPEKCIHCEMCDRLCPDFAITGARR
jgi:2-oxoglutarate ferredoxin oxidoreductase subunit delta